MSTQLCMSSIFDDVVKKLILTYSEVHSRPATTPLSGYVHLLEHGNAIFITDERQPYLIPLEFALFHHLKTGDRMQARVTYDSDCGNNVVSELIEVQHVTYDEAPMKKAEQTINLDHHTIKLGTSILIPTTDNTDVAAKVAQIQNALPDDVEPVLLSIDGRQTNFDVPTAYFTKPTYSSREKLMTCLLAFFHAKQQADIGKNVVIIVDSLDKMFFAFNNCMQSAGTIDPNLYSSAAMMDYENILISSGNLQAGGSLTIIGLHCPGTSPILQQVDDRLHQIMDQILELK